MARQWQCSPKLDEALEEMSGWFKNAGEELEAKAEDAFGPAASLRPLDLIKSPSEAQHGDSLKSPVEAEATGADVASHIFGTAKAVLEQSRQEFMQLLQGLDGSTQTQAEQHPSHASPLTSETKSLQPPTSPPGSTKSCHEEEAPGEQPLVSPPEKHWKRSLKSKKKGRGSVAESPFSPGLVSPCSYASCLYPKREIVEEKLQERRVEGSNGLCKQVSDDTFFVRADSAKQKGTITMPGLASKASTPWHKKDLGRASRSQKEAMRVRIRITPQHFSPLGTMFRDVQVDFFPSSFTIRALDCEGYAWTAYSNHLPGDIDTDKCRFKIDPSGKDVIISLQKAGSQSWQDLTRLELTRPYHLSSPDSLG